MAQALETPQKTTQGRKGTPTGVEEGGREEVMH